RDNVARLDRHPLREVLQNDVDREEHIARSGVLPCLAVDAQRDPLLLRITELVGGDDDRSHRTETVEAFPFEPLLVPELKIPGGDVIDDRIAEYMIERRPTFDVLAADPDNNAQFGLVIDLTGCG